MNYRVCRECGEEFRPEVARCSDCGGELSDVYEDESGQVVGPPPSPLVAPAPPPEAELADFRPIFVGAQAGLLVPLAERLKANQVAFRLAEEMADSERGTASFSLLVREEDRARALTALAPLLGDETGEGRLHAVESHFADSAATPAAPPAIRRSPPTQPSVRSAGSWWRALAERPSPPLLAAVVALWRLPKVRVLADGSWRVGGFPILHAASLRHLKSRLVFEVDQAFIEDGDRRLSVEILGPAFEVTVLRLDRGRASLVLLDDGSENIGETSLSERRTGRFDRRRGAGGPAPCSHGPPTRP
jgi:hypothetical protein